MKNVLFSFIVLALISISANSQVVKTQIGQSKYDLQTNGSIVRRVAVDPVTKNIIATYTGSSASDGAFSDRGPGYAFWNGTQWSGANNGVLSPPVTMFPPNPAPGDRTGWPNPMFLKSGKEAIISHRATSSFGDGLSFVYRAAAGSGTWTNVTATGLQLTWPRAGNSGDSIFVITSTLGGSINGMTGGLGFIRSYDGGVTWTPGIDSIQEVNLENYPNFTPAGGTERNTLGGDQYSLDVKGNKVAVITGSYDVSLYLSNNFGNSWTKKTIISGTDENKKVLVDGASYNAENRSDGSFSVLIDNNGITHCFWGRDVTYTGVDNAGVTGNFIDISKSGIMYWNESMGSKAPIVIPGSDFLRESSTAPSNNVDRFNRTGSNGQNIGYQGSLAVYNMNTSTWPSAGVDDMNNIYLTYAYNRGIIDTTNKGILKDADKTGYNLMDVMVMKSTNGGVSWIGPYNVSNSPVLENSYPSMARYVGDSLYIIWQEDSLHGNAISTTVGASTNGTGSQQGPIYTDNKMILAKVATSLILSPSSDITPPVLTFKNSYRNNFFTQGPGFIIASFINCNKDTATKAVITLNKKFLVDNLFSVSDNSGGIDSNLLFESGLSSVNLSSPGTYTVRVWAKDVAGNLSQFVNGWSGGTTGFINFDTAIVQFIVLNDAEAPKIELKGNSITLHYKGQTFVDPGVIVTDNNPCATITQSQTGNVDVNTIGTNTITYSASDGTNNSNKTRTVLVSLEPIANITAESLNNVTKTVSGDGSTSQYITLAEGNPKFSWTTNVGSNGVLGTTKTLTNVSVASKKSFDSLCLTVTSEFNLIGNKPSSRTCKYLKYTAGINSLENNSSIDVYPNPSNGSFTLKVNGLISKEANISISNIDGRVLVNQKLKITANDEIPVNLDLSKGVYFLNTEVNGVNHSNRLEIK